MLVTISTMVFGYHLMAVAGTRESPVCVTGSQVPDGSHVVARSGGIAPDIILVTFDALTARDMSLYGYRLPTTPGMQQLAQESYVYEHAVSVSNWTKPGTVSILTGQYPHHHHLFSTQADAMTLQHHERTLPNLLRKMGYQTVAVVSNPGYAHPFTNGTYRSFDACTWDAFSSEFLDGNVFLRLRHNIRGKVETVLLDYDIYIAGWLNDLLDSFAAVYFSQQDASLNEKSIAPPERTFTQAQQAILKESKQPKFVWVHVFPPHGPYFPNEKYSGRFLPGDDFSTVRSQNKIPAGDYSKNLQADADRLRLRYDESILDADQAFADFVDFLKKSGRWENTLLVVSADHGESFEDGFRGHRGEHLYEQLIHIPLLIHLPGQRDGPRIDATASQVDIGPTILNYLKAPIPSWMDGEPLGLGAGERKTYRYSMEMEANGVRPPISKGIVTATDGRYKLVYSLTRNSIELFDLKLDPDESKNIAGENAALVERMRTAVMNEIKS